MSEVPLLLTLSPPDLHALELAQTALLSPLEFRNTDSWRVVASARIAQLIGAHHADFTPPRASGASPRRAAAGSMEPADRVFAGIEPAGTAQSRTRRRLASPDRVPLYHATRGVSEVIVEWLRPGHLIDRDGVDFDPGTLVADVRVTDQSDQQSSSTADAVESFGERELAFLRLLLPAFRAGVRTHLAFAAHRETLAGMFDHIADGAAVWDSTGKCRYRNPALDHLLAADAERATVERRLVDLVRSMVTGGAALRATAGHTCDLTLATLSNRYHVQATHAAGLGARAPWVLVLVRPARRIPSAESLRLRYGLTPRQSEVAQRLAEGQSDAVIARALRISRRTAEHHAEAVRLTLGVHSRAVLAAALQQDI